MKIFAHSFLTHPFALQQASKMRMPQPKVASNGERPRYHIEMNITRGAVFKMLFYSLPVLCLLSFVWCIYQKLSPALDYPASLGLVDLEG